MVSITELSCQSALQMQYYFQVDTTQIVSLKKCIETKIWNNLSKKICFHFKDSLFKH
jgi:hypothetical protein